MKTILKTVPVILIFLVSISIINAQNKEEAYYYDDIDLETHKEIGLNFTQFVGQFIPLNLQSPKDGPIGYSFKWYNEKGLAFRFGFGARINSDFDDSFISLRLGYEKRRHLAKKFYFTRGWDLMGVVGSFNISNSVNEVAALGVGPVIGLEYHLTDALIISTESMLFVGISAFEGINLTIIPPTALLVHFRF